MPAWTNLVVVVLVWVIAQSTPGIPTWGAWLIGASAVIVAVSVIWSKVLKPGARLIAQLEKTYPLLVRITDIFEEGDELPTLREIADQFKNNSGSSLKDATDRLEVMVSEAHAIAVELRMNFAVAKELAALDREQIHHVKLLVARLTDHVTDIAKADAVVAANLAKADARVEGVASDLAAGHARADETPHGSSPGAAADAASRTPVNGGSDVLS